MKQNKIMMLSAALIIAGAAALFANGAAEVNEGTWQPGMGRAVENRDARGGIRAGNNTPGSRLDLYTEGETVTLEGELTEIDGELMFTAGSKVMTISAPGYPRSGFTPEAGTSLTVEGKVYDSLETCPVENDGHLIVTAAELDGERYDFTAATATAPGRGAGAGAGTRKEGSAGGRNTPRGRAADTGRGRAGSRGKGW